MVEPEVKEELYPDTDRQGPIGAWDPETAGQETQAMEPAGDGRGRVRARPPRADGPQAS